MEIFRITLNVEGKEIIYSFDINDQILELDNYNKYQMNQYISTKEINKAREQLAEMVKSMYSKETINSKKEPE